MIYLLQPVDFRSDNNAQKAPILLCKDKIESGCCSKSRYHKPINFQRTNLWSADPWVWGYQRSKSDLAFINRFYRCFLRGVYMSIMLISEASHNGVTLSENIVEGFEHRENSAYACKFYFKAGL